MKFYCLLVFVFLLSVDAQRRSVNSELLSENDPQPRSARRGRARFTVTSDSPQLEELPRRSEPITRRLVSRRRPESHAEIIPARKSYEVDEVVDEVAPDAFRRTSKTKVLTETKYEALNVPPSNTLFQPSTTENFDEIVRSIGGDFLDTTSSSISLSSTLPANLEPASSEITSGEFTRIDNEISRVVETTTPLTTRTTHRSNGRFRSNSNSAPATAASSRVRTRGRPTRRPEEQNSVAPPARVSYNRASRRRPEVNTEIRPSTEQPARVRNEPRTRAPPAAPEVAEPPRARHIEPRTRASLVASAETVEVPSRLRNGRRIPTARRVEEPKVPERVPVDLPQARRFTSRKSVDTTTIRSRSRSRSREIPPVIDEQKLEVLPLFERETKTVRPVRKFVSRRRNLNSAEEVETSATENDVKVASQAPKESVVVETRTEATIKRRSRVSSRTTKPTAKSTVKTYKPTAKSTVKTYKPSTTVRTTRTTTTSKPIVLSTKSNVQQSKPSKPIIRESVISEITEVTSKRTITRSKPGRAKVELPKSVSRGTKKSEVNSTVTRKAKSNLSSSEEDIEESDNYPEPFKALIQAKKQKKESRSPQHLTTASPAVTKSTEKVVVSSSSSTTPVVTSEAIRQLEDFENELEPSKSVRPTPRRRLSQSTEKTTRSPRKNKFNRSTATVSTSTTPDHRFHAKFNNEPEVTSSNPVKPSRGFSPKPPRGLYSSRKTKESFIKNKSTTAQIPTPKKSNRYSSRYRNDASSRGAIRTSTNAPAYLPTIPTITPPTTSVKSSVAYQDKDLGVEVISFDDPVNTVPSANLVSGEYLASSTDKPSPLVPDSQTKTTEKPVSIIERIINSITAISTTEVPDLTRLTTPASESPTKQSAILKLATKKSTKLDKTQTTQKIPIVTVTSEKPTTIIERILSSLSAIQADNSTDTKHLKSKQVGTNFNTISFPSTTPITRVTKSTLTAPISTSVNPLYLLDQISNDQILQKRTIDKLLALLNTLTTPSPHPLVVVTPKTTNYVLGSSANTATTTTTTEPTTTTETTTQLFTSPSSNVALNSRAKLPTVKYTTTPTYTTLTTFAPTSTPEISTVSAGEAVTTNPVPTSSSPTLTSTQVPTSTGRDDFSNDIGALPLFVRQQFESSTSSGADSTTSSVDFSIPISSTLPPTDFNTDTETNFAFPSTIPALVNFEVSPGSVSVFSANDISNAITPVDIPSSSVTISGRANSPESTTPSTIPTQTTISVGTTTSQPSVTLASRVAGTDSTENNLSDMMTTSVTPSGTLSSVTTGGTTTPPDEAGSTTLAPGTATTVVPTTDSTADNNTTQDISSNIIDTTDSSVKSNQTSTVSPSTNITTKASGRSGRLLAIVEDSVQNSIETNRTKDYFIFAVLNNNTVLRKRPSSFPNKETPFLIVGVYPNNTIVRKFPNGTLVPMEPIIRVSGFDTRENPPPLPEITSNQVTPDQGSQPENKNLQTVDQNTVPPFEANPLSISSVNNATNGTTSSSTVPSVRANPLSVSSPSSTTTESSTTTSTSSSSTTAPATSTTPGTTTSSTAPTATLPTLSEILNGRTVKAFNSIINISDLSKVQTLDVDPKTNRVLNTDELNYEKNVIFRWKPVTTSTYTFENAEERNLVSTTLPSPTLSNRILDEPSTTPPTTTTTTQQPKTTTYAPRRTSTPLYTTTTTFLPPTTTYFPTTTIPPSTVASFIRTRGTTVLPLSQPATSTLRTTTGFPTTTFLPQFLTTLISTLRPRRVTTEAPFTIVTPISNSIQSTPIVEINTPGDLVSASSTRRPVRTTSEPLTTLPVSTTIRNSRRRGTPPTTTTTEPTTTTVFTTTTFRSRNTRGSTTTEPTTTTSATKRLRQLTDQQKKDLQTLAQLEMEQAALLRQLSFLTNLNFANSNAKPTTEKNELANKVIALAVERDKERQKTTTPPPEETNRQAKKISAENPHNIEDLLKQLSIATPSTITSEYGKSDDAIIAALLKEQGIGPTTPKVLEDVYSLTTTTKKPKTTTRRPGPLMSSLNWLLNVLAPPTTKRPKPKTKSKPKPKPKPKSTESHDELLTHQPTHLTPVVTPPPRQNIVSSLSQRDIQKLIKQLETIQKDPNNSKELDFSSIKSLQSLINSEEGVKVTSSGNSGTTSRETTPMTTSKRKGKSKSRVAKSTTAIPLSVSNSIAEEDFTTTTKPRVTLPPVRLRPIPGIEDDGTMVRGQLVSAAVNVTRAISSFLGTALQGAATSFQSLVGTGSRMVGSLMQVSSNTSSRPG